MKNNQFLAISITCLCGLGAFGFYLFHSDQDKQDQKLQLEQALAQVDHLNRKDHPLLAFGILSRHEADLAFFPEFKAKWNKLALTNALNLEDDKRIFQLATLNPELFSDREDMSLKAAKTALSERNFVAYTNLAKEWRIEGKEKPNWLLLEADALALKGEPSQAIELLSNQSFNDQLEIARLVRLALLNENEHPKVAWEYLLKALRINPNDPELHFYRAQLLSSTQNENLAVIEYKEAIAKDTKNPFYKEQLLDFYLRQHNYHEAFQFLSEALDAPSSDKLWLKTLFLNKVYQPSKLNLAKNSPPTGISTPFIRYLLAVSNENFWDESLLVSQPAVEKIGENIVEANWLKVFENLRTGYDARALEILTSHPEMADLNPTLYDGLQIAIVSLNPLLKAKINQKNIFSSMHPAFTIIKEPNLPKDYASLMASRESYAALTLASGWYEAALNLQKITSKSESYEQLSPLFPRWVPYGFAKALISNRSPESALKFINAQYETPQLALLAAELNIQLKNYSQGEKKLVPLSNVPNPIGLKAALLLSKAYLEQKNYDLAKLTILNNSELADSVIGKEALAKVELQFGESSRAENIYAAIKDVSLEAKSYFAKKAFAIKDYKTAYKLTKHLVDQYPNRTDFKASLTHIAKAASSNQNY